jgi:hypothetical protein
MAVPRFFFHLHNDLDTCDEEGRDLPDLAAARSAAEEDARHMAAESVREGRLNTSHFVEVSGDDGQSLLRVTFGEVVKIIA